MNWSDGRLLAFDTETTGTDPETARIVSAACLWRGGASEAADEEWLVNPGVPIPAEATAIHGITDEMACCDRHVHALRKHYHGDEGHSHPHHETK